MTSEEKSMRGCWWAFLGLVALSFVTNFVLLSRQTPQPNEVIKHDTVWRDTTIYRPVPTDSTPTGKVVVVRVPYYIDVPGDTVHDSIDVPVPIYQKRYDDSLYTAWVSGYRPALDSIRLHQPTVIETITRTIVQPAHRLSVGIQAGAGVGTITHTPDIYIGVGIQYRLWSK